ncbi:hypothetical protein F4703DRAFT_1767739 [Phycomyces blakesleeanus]
MFNKNMVAKDNLIKDFLQQSAQREKETNPLRVNSRDSTHSLLTCYSEAARVNAEQMQRITQQLQASQHYTWIDEPDKKPVKRECYPDDTPQSLNNTTQPDMTTSTNAPSSTSTSPPPICSATAAVSMNAGSLVGSPLKTAEGVAFVTLGRVSPHVAIRDNKPGIELTMPTIDNTKKATFSWTVPPRVLLVDDDSVYRDLSGKLLQVIGCTIDLAKDGVEAIGKMGAEKYDLILMDIMMPNLDGISATRNIRQYDALTPIISMTSNFTDNDIMQYIGSGMTDILPKPFSKRTLYNMLEKYCAHLRAIQRGQGSADQISAVQRGLGNLGLPLQCLTPNAMQLEPANNTTSTTSNSSSSSSSSSNNNNNGQYSETSVASSSSSSSSSFVYPYPTTMVGFSHSPYSAPAGSPTTFWISQDQPEVLPPSNDGPTIVTSADGKLRWAAPPPPTALPIYDTDPNTKRRRLDHGKDHV